MRFSWILAILSRRKWLFEYFSLYFIHHLFIHLATDVCDIGTSDCDPNRSMCVMNDDENSDFYSCSCSDGYLSNSTTQCLDYCEKGADDCDKVSTNCTATPGILPHYKCVCKLGYNRKDNTTCVLPPTGEPTTGSTDGKEMTLWIQSFFSISEYTIKLDTLTRSLSRKFTQILSKSRTFLFIGHLSYGLF